jgi:formylmethanofuran dehydrogenase subunit C
MVKKIKFPLEVANGVQARTIEELKDNFDIDKVLEYFIEGKLQTWLEDRYYEEEAEKISTFSISQSDLKTQLADVFGVTYDAEEIVDVEAIEIRNQKLKKLKQFTEDEEILRSVDSVAFDQEELS